MPRRLTRDEWIAKAVAVHGDRYDYSGAVYAGASKPVSISCPLHGEFMQIAGNHSSGEGCWSCGREAIGKSKQVSAEEFIERATIAHGGKYDYSAIDFRGMNCLTVFDCPVHGQFQQKPVYHSRGNGCPVCAESARIKGRTKTFAWFLGMARAVHGDKFTYFEQEYVNLYTKTFAECRRHGRIEILPSNHIRGTGCPDCSGKRRPTTERFIAACRKAHGDKYSYSKTIYKNKLSEVIVTCRRHGDFSQAAHSHRSGHGCPKCMKSTGNDLIHLALSGLGIKAVAEKTFPSLRHKKRLRLDAYIPSLKMAVEFDGRQHFPGCRGWIGDSYEGIAIRDAIKDRWCKDNGVDLLRIPYWEKKHIPRILFHALWECRVVYGPPVVVMIRKRPPAKTMKSKKSSHRRAAKVSAAVAAN